MKSTVKNVKSKGATAVIASAPPARRQRALRDYAGLVARGFCMGAADVVPGVSGGTMAFILGIYEELIESIRNVGQPPFLEAALKFRWREALQLLNWPFLLAVAGGIGLAIVTLAPGLEWLLENQPVYLWSFFFGLVLASVFVVTKRVSRWTAPLLGGLALGAVGAYALVGLAPVQTPTTWWFLFLSGALAITAMILPGISGAFILVLLGKYQYVLSAVNQRDMVTIGLVALGAGVGIVTIAQLLSWLFKRYHDMTVAILIGLMLGSLRKVWPWKVDLEWLLDRHGKQLPTLQQNVLPELWLNGSLNPEVVVAFILAVIAVSAVLALDYLANRPEATAVQLRAES
jgi:putative membrane protein